MGSIVKLVNSGITENPIRLQHGVHRLIQLPPTVLAVRTLRMYWRYVHCACTGGTYTVHVLAVRTRCMYWRYIHGACTGGTYTVHVLAVRTRCMYWRYVHGACTGGTYTVYVLYTYLNFKRTRKQI